MQVVVDTNVIISALLTISKTFEIMVFGDLELYVPEYALGEIERHKDELRKRMGVGEEEFVLALNIILSHVIVISRQQYLDSEAKARKISPDPSDFPFFALAPARKIPIWTNETRLKKQGEVAVYNTGEIIALVGLS
jgi:predicted nucleic acid-binding protein